MKFSKIIYSVCALGSVLGLSSLSADFGENRPNIGGGGFAPSPAMRVYQNQQGPSLSPAAAMYLSNQQESPLHELAEYRAGAPGERFLDRDDGRGPAAAAFVGGNGGMMNPELAIAAQKMNAGLPLSPREQFILNAVQGGDFGPQFGPLSNFAQATPQLRPTLRPPIARPSPRAVAYLASQGVSPMELAVLSQKMNSGFSLTPRERVIASILGDSSFGPDFGSNFGGPGSDIRFPAAAAALGSDGRFSPSDMIMLNAMQGGYGEPSLGGNGNLGELFRAQQGPSALRYVLSNQ